jgi:hypothetical protein
MSLWNKRLKYYKFLIGIGFFKSEVNSYEYSTYTNFLAVRHKHYAFQIIDSVFLGIYRILPIMFSVILKKSCFLFIDLKKTNVFFISRFYTILNHLPSFVIYDWTYGILTNFFRIELKLYTYSTNSLPSLSFLLAMFKNQKVICNELSRKNLLTVGLISVGTSLHIDYPIFIVPLAEFSCIFFQILLKAITTNWHAKKKIQV